MYDSQGNLADFDLKPQDGTIEVTRSKVVVSYLQEGVTHRVEYEMTPAR